MLQLDRVRASVLFASFLVACATEPPASALATNGITSIPESAVKHQGQTGNCWIYSTLAWVESIAANPVSGETKNLSVAYVNYWRWYDQITDGSQTVSYGGWWGEAVELLARYGVASMGTFVNGDEAVVSVQAQNVLNEALSNGELSTAEARNDRAKVIAVLNRAWGVLPSVADGMAKTFGADGLSTFDIDPSKASFRSTKFSITSPRDVRVRLAYKDATQSATGSLATAIGTRKAGHDANLREGVFAWSAVDVDPTTMDATARRAFLRRLQIALHDGVPLPIVWTVVLSNWQGARNAFAGVIDPNLTYSAYGGLHMTLLDDYEATNVPGFGTLRAGEPATHQQQIAALDDATTVTMLRVKNSWGTALASIAPGKTPKLFASPTEAGYYDLGTDYLFSSTNAAYSDASGFVSTHRFSGLVQVVLPATY